VCVCVCVCVYNMGYSIGLSAWGFHGGKTVGEDGDNRLLQNSDIHLPQYMVS
jgi:hypothetical protein